MFLARFGEDQYELIGGVVCGWIWVDLVPLGSQGGQVIAGTLPGWSGLPWIEKSGWNCRLDSSAGQMVRRDVVKVEQG
ncbi:uncharacterized protein N7498_007459 [Penicillium cinerascens]|uniref:Uncharacterized protein n=1 Tax=Penicillium cinerascens TaxID=70096 RepID=A0A9W9JLX5_9EURO|nr:uncharacterized protein N7498_007459 [Penicillium cinerascens]KAJ5198342.1 hypothetical protein N7498_007459 [Penicillium cinerascens]